MGYSNLPDGVRESDIPGYNDREIPCPECGGEVTVDGGRYGDTTAYCDPDYDGCGHEWDWASDEADAWAEAIADQRERASSYWD